MQHKEAAREMLKAVDTFMSGAKLSDEQRELEREVMMAGCYAAAAYDEHSPKSGGELHAMVRTFLVALIDPLHPDLDYLRADPAAGAVARDAAARLDKITNP